MESFLGKLLVLNCPHCEGVFLVYEREINCCIFRHSQELSPHASQEECENWVRENPNKGCAKPFKIIRSGDEYKTESCEYI